MTAEMLYCWGSSDGGQLGSSKSEKCPGGAETCPPTFEEPTLHSFQDSFPSRVVKIAAGLEHTLYLCSNGEVYASGNGEVGQLGAILPSHNKQVYTPIKVCGALSSQCIVDIAAGEQYSVAITSYGQVFSWGQNVLLQCGIKGEENTVTYPSLVKCLTHSNIVQISCGANHTLALAADGSVYGWGVNRHGQLAIDGDIKLAPTKILKLQGLPIRQVACGGRMSACLTRAGFLVTWGANEYCQLGRASKGITPKGERVSKDCSFCPFVADNLKHYSYPIVYVSAGNRHVAALDCAGKLWTFGSNAKGQLGHGDSTGETEFDMTPRTIFELVGSGSKVTQVECGLNHTLIIADGKVYSFGDGSLGQLGLGNKLPASKLVSTPHLVLQHWKKEGQKGDSVRTADTAEDGTEPMDVDDSENRLENHVEKIYCGYDNCFLITTTIKSECVDRSQSHYKKAQLQRSQKSSSCTDLKQAGATGPLCIALTQTGPAEVASSTPPPVATSEMLMTLPVYELQQNHLDDLLKLDPHEPVEESIFSYLETAIGSVQCWNQSFMQATDERKFDDSLIDLDAMDKYMLSLKAITRDTIEDMVFSGIQKVVHDLPSCRVTGEALRAFILLPHTPQFSRSEYYKHYETIHARYAKKYCALTAHAKETIASWLKNELPLRVLETIVGNFVGCLDYVISKFPDAGSNSNSAPKPVTDDLVFIIMFLKDLHGINRDLSVKLPADVFYVKSLFSKVEFLNDYICWLQSMKLRHENPDAPIQRFFCDYPFLFDCRSKTKLLKADSTLQMSSAAQNLPYFQLLRFFTGVEAMPVLELTVRRDNLLEDTINFFKEALIHPERNFKLPLTVRFRDEAGQDEGGVRKEFFMLLMKQVISSTYGMFKYYDESRYYWFSDFIFEENTELFSVIGKLCGLAIYNSVTVQLDFPVALYKKLLGEKVTLQDLCQLDPVLGKGLEDLLKYEGDDLEDVFYLNFVLDREHFDGIIKKELKPDGENITVKQSNKQEYVDLVVSFIFDTSIKEAYESFAKGFQSICNGHVVKLFQPHELMFLLTGDENYDWEQFRQETQYKEPYSAEHQTIVFFWEVFFELDLDLKKKFLLFLTGCDRVPALGMSAIKMTVTPVDDAKLLPVAHTCVCQLDLPKYDDKATLKTKLETAIQNCHGFGLA